MLARGNTVGNVPVDTAELLRKQAGCKYVASAGVFPNTIPEQHKTPGLGPFRLEQHKVITATAAAVDVLSDYLGVDPILHLVLVVHTSEKASDLFFVDPFPA